MEDVFQSNDLFLALFSRRGAGQQKGWINRTLEENPVPAIWITNRTAGMDPAFLRRFLLPLACGTPPHRAKPGPPVPRRRSPVPSPEGNPQLRSSAAPQFHFSLGSAPRGNLCSIDQYP